MELKEILLDFCWAHVNIKKDLLSKRSISLQESLNSETKSSAGDKHETGRAMVQLEQEKLGQQQVVLDQMQRVLQQINIESQNQKVGLGNLVKTTLGTYFIAIGAGVFKMENGEMVYCISANSPIAQLVMGKMPGASYVFRGNTHKILKIT